MRIFHIVSRRFLTGLSSEYNFRLRARLLNSDIYVEEDLTEKDIAKANDSDAIYTRSGLSPDLLARFKVPVFIQHENPLVKYGSFSDRAVYVTDVAYVPHFPMAEPMPQLILDEDAPSSEKDFDVIFIGHSRGWNGLRSKLLRIFLRAQTNNFGSVFDVVSSGKYAWIFSILRMILPTNTYMKILWYATNVIRGLRRERILLELRGLAEAGVRVAVVGDEGVLGRVGTHPGIWTFGVSEWNVVKDLMRRSIFTIATTPLHQSIMDGRYFEALQCNSIPLYEPYPQYLQLSPEHTKSFVFDYADRPLGAVVKNLLENLQQAKSDYQNVRESALQVHGSDQYISGYQELVKRYRKTI